MRRVAHRWFGFGYDQRCLLVHVLYVKIIREGKTMEESKSNNLGKHSAIVEIIYIDVQNIKKHNILQPHITIKIHT